MGIPSIGNNIIFLGLANSCKEAITTRVSQILSKAQKLFSDAKLVCSTVEGLSALFLLTVSVIDMFTILKSYSSVLAFIRLNFAIIGYMLGCCLLGKTNALLSVHDKNI